MAYTYKDYEESQRIKNLRASADAAYAQLEQQNPFAYDVNGDALYQQYKDQYMKAGKQAMQDTMGQASALTGGYGNSYAASAGNQAYQAYLGRLNEAVPQLYSLALDKYNADQQALMNKANMYNSRYADEYGREYGLYGDKWSRDFSAYQQGVSEDQWNRNFNEGVRQYNESLAENRRQFDATLGLNYNKYYSSSNATYNPFTGAYDSSVYGGGGDDTDTDKKKKEPTAAEKIRGTGKAIDDQDSGFIKKTITDNFGNAQTNLQKIKSSIPTRAQYEKSGKNASNYAGDVRRMINNYVNSGAITAEEAATLYYYYGIA